METLCFLPLLSKNHKQAIYNSIQFNSLCDLILRNYILPFKNKSRVYYCSYFHYFFKIIGNVRERLVLNLASYYT